MISSQPRYDHFDTSPYSCVGTCRRTADINATRVLYHNIAPNAIANSKKLQQISAFLCRGAEKAVPATFCAETAMLLREGSAFTGKTLF